MLTNELLDQFADVIASKVAERLQKARRPAKRLLTASEAADYIGRSLGALQHLTSSGELPVVRNGRRVHYAVDDLDRWIDENKVNA